jgi:YD repeat-containing protein
VLESWQKYGKSRLLGTNSRPEVLGIELTAEDKGDLRMPDRVRSDGNRWILWASLALSALVAVGGVASAAPKTTTYAYDALGRLTFVTDTQNGNRDYDYDKTGNRLLVAVGESTDQAMEPGAPNSPTGLLKTYIQNCVWRANWTAVPGAVNYKVLDTVGNEQTVTTNQAYVNCPFNNQNGNKPKWVRACSSTGACSFRAYF